MSECFVRDLFLSCNSANISYAVLRGYERLPEEIGNDIDLGVSGEDLGQFLALLHSVASVHDYGCEINLYRQNVLKMSLVRSTDSSLVKIDVWWAFKYCGLEYLDITDLLSSRKHYKELFYVPRAEHEVALSFLKELLHMKRIRSDKVALLRAKQSAHFDEPFKRFFRPSLISYFRKAINEERLSRPLLSWGSVFDLGLGNVKHYGAIRVLSSVSECLGIRFFEIGKGRFLEICRRLS